MTDEIELHDSDVELLCATGELTLHFCPAYVHHWEQTDSGWVGEGRAQNVDIVIADGVVECSQVTGQFEISDGDISIDGDVLHNMIPVPMQRVGVVRGRLQSTYGKVVTFVGRGLTVQFAGAWESMESLPPDWAPDRDDTDD